MLPSSTAMQDELDKWSWYRGMNLFMAGLGIVGAVVVSFIMLSLWFAIASGPHETAFYVLGDLALLQLAVLLTMLPCLSFSSLKDAVIAHRRLRTIKAAQ